MKIGDWIFIKDSKYPIMEKFELIGEKDGNISFIFRIFPSRKVDKELYGQEIENYHIKNYNVDRKFLNENVWFMRYDDINIVKKVCEKCVK